MKNTTAKRAVIILSGIASIYFVVSVVLHVYTDATYQKNRFKDGPIDDDDSEWRELSSETHYIVDKRTVNSYPSILSQEAVRKTERIEKTSRITNVARIKDKRNCRMENCFNFTRCSKFRVHVHPSEAVAKSNGLKRSATYDSILEAIRRSPFYTSEPDEACVFFLAYDTTDRDPNSNVYEPAINDSLLRRLPHWNNGMNHVIVNFFGGTWPSYDEHAFGFDPGFAMLAKASSSIGAFRPGFDFSVPLISGNLTDSSWLRERDGERSSSERKKSYLLGFKGKRYVFGIGSETRNALYHLSNRSQSGDILLLTTCRHGRNWQQFSDERCVADNEQYEAVDYAALLHDTRFCLVPRGRRLGSFRFLESLAAGCIPVVLSNDWVLPFDSTVDWRTVSVQLDERTLSIVPAAIRMLATDDTAVKQLERNVRSVYAAHFSSISTIVDTLLNELNNRVKPVIVTS